jgi:hypothetical protein
MDPTTGEVACAWAHSYTLSVPSTWTSGVYLALLTRADGYQNYIIFDVRDDSSHAALLFQNSVTTYEAYNAWGGKSLYGSSSDESNNADRAHAVSFDRPYQSGRGPFEFLNWEYHMVRWLEREGYDVTYATDVDTHEAPALLLQHRGFLSVGHDEYWSKAMRTGVEAALAQGVNLGFFGADAMYWQIRLGSSPLGPDRVITCYKDASLDPEANVDPTQVTVRWRDAPVNRPENALIGVMYSSYFTAAVGYPFVVRNIASWVYRGIPVSNGQEVPTLVGYEYDKVFNNGATPPGLVVVGQSPVTDVYGHADVANATVYTAPSGASVFAAGTIRWANGLDTFGAGTAAGVAESVVQGATANVLARWGVVRTSGPSETATPSVPPTPTRIPSPSLAPTLTALPTPVPTLVPPPTASPTRTPLPTPTAVPTPQPAPTAVPTRPPSRPPSVRGITVEPKRVKGGRTTACPRQTNAQRLPAGCVLISSVSARGARVTYTLDYPRGAHLRAATFTGTADRQGRVLHVFNVPYRPRAGAKPGAPETVVSVRITVLFPGSKKPKIANTHFAVTR